MATSLSSILIHLVFSTKHREPFITPEIEPELRKLENAVIAPHIASASHETRLKMCMMAADNLLAVLKGNRPPNLVNPEVWDKRRK